MSYCNYYQKKENRKSDALEHFRKMDIHMKSEIKHSIKETTIYRGDGIAVPHVEKEKSDSQTSYITIDSLDSVSSLFQHKQGKTAVLNFASYKNPGGKFLEGSFAQEECLCHASTLYNVLMCIPEYYNWNIKHKNNSLYTDRALYSKDIIFFDTGDSPRQEKETADVITCAAPNFAAAYKYSHITADKNLTVLMERIRFILDIVADNHVDTLISGAFGCGAFGQDAAVVAYVFKSFLEKFDYGLKNIYFSVPDTGKDANYQKFRYVFCEYKE